MRFLVWVMICCTVFFLYPTIGQSKEKMTISAKNAVLMEEETGRVLFDKQADEQRSIASITKVMTALVAIRYGELSDKVTVSNHAAHSSGSSVYLKEADEMTLEDLLYGLLLRSGNDAAVAIAEHVGGSEEGFVYLMNETATYIGMTNTHFANPHGLDDPMHYSSAYDMALLMREAYKNDVFKKMARTQSHQAESIDYPWHNKNKLLTGMYDPITGGKTGYTSQAGRTLITTAEKKELTLIAVTLNAPDDWNDHMRMYEWGFNSFDMIQLDEPGKKKFEKNEQQFTGFTTKDFVYPLRHEERKEIHRQVKLKKNPSEQEEQVGLIRYVMHSNVLKEIPIYKERKQEQKRNLNLKDILYKVLKVEYDG